jgi:hypothetical protein
MRPIDFGFPADSAVGESAKALTHAKQKRPAEKTKRGELWVGKGTHDDKSIQLPAPLRMQKKSPLG